MKIYLFKRKKYRSTSVDEVLRRFNLTDIPRNRAMIVKVKKLPERRKSDGKD